MEALTSKAYVLVLCDFDMGAGVRGVLTGAELVAEFRAWEAINQPGSFALIYALTSHTGDDVVRQCQLAGMQGLLSKPFDALEIMDILDAAVVGGGTRKLRSARPWDATK